MKIHVIVGILWAYIIIGYMAEVVFENTHPTWYAGTTIYLILTVLCLFPNWYITKYILVDKDK